MSGTTTTGDLFLKVYLFLPDPAQTIADGYDLIVISRSDDEGEFFEEVDEADGGHLKIKETQCNYVYVANDASRDTIFQAILRDSTGVAPDLPQSTLYATDTTFETILSIEELKTLYLFGLDLTNDEGTPYPDALYAHYIQYAIDSLREELDLDLLPTKREEFHDYIKEDFRKYIWMQLDHKPVQSIDEKVELLLPNNQSVVSFEKEWNYLDKARGHLQIIPGTGSPGVITLSAVGTWLPFLAGVEDFLPQSLKVIYTSGFELGKVPYSIKELVGKRAAFGPLNIAGDLLGGAGIASQSISLDGLSQSFNTTSSATSAGYGARLLQYEKELKAAIPKVRDYYSNIKFVVA